MPSNSPTLWIVAAPLGNSGDLSPRARSILSDADLVLAEDTRRTARLLKDVGVRAKRLISFFDHNEEEKIPEVLAALRDGLNVALIPDAGSPLVADPGYRLVRACRDAGFRVSPVPGPSAPVAALSVAGIPPIPFSFLGFPPRADGARRALFRAFAAAPGSLVFFERKDRLWATLRVAREILGEREVAVCRELTKTYEEIIVGTLGKLEERELLGELAVIIGPAQSVERTDPETALALIRELTSDGLSRRDATARAKEELAGWSGKELIQLLNKSGDD